MKKQKKSDAQIRIDERVAEIESWGILTLMSRMKEAFLHDLERDRRTLASFWVGKYEDSSLQLMDKLINAFENKYNEEFIKIYNQVEAEYEKRKESKI